MIFEGPALGFAGVLLGAGGALLELGPDVICIMRVVSGKRGGKFM